MNTKHTKIMVMKKLQNSKYFSVNEMLHSDKAERLKIDNTPKSDEIVDNIQYLMGRLDEIRDGYGKPIYINSAYRCPKLNEAVGGVSSSYHQMGLAADLRYDSELKDYIIKNCQFGRLIEERSKSAIWIHIQFKRNRNEETNKVIYMTV